MVCALVGTEDLVSVAPEVCAFDSVGAMRAHYPCYLASTNNLCISQILMAFALVAIDSVDLVADARALCFSCRPLNGQSCSFDGNLAF